MAGFFDILTIILSFAIPLAVLVPITGGLVRFRANYNPKGLQLDPEGNVQAHTGPVIRTLVGMLRRVYRIEGVSGLYKGLMPTLLSAAVLLAFLAIFYDLTSMPLSAHGAPATGAFGILAFSLFQMIITLPTIIITYRAITTPHKLPYFSPLYSLRILLTPTERRRPWILYLTPGLLASQSTHIAYVVLGLRTLRHLLLPTVFDSSHKPKLENVSTARLVIYFMVVVISTAILTPLEVISTRLAIQRNHSAAEFNSVSQEEEGDAEDVIDYAGAEEDVIGLRNERDPYLGLVDCAKRVVEEEGWMALYRAWWLTMLGGLLGAFS